MVAVDLGAARIAIGLACFHQLGAHHLGQAFGAREDVAQLGDARQQLLVLGDDLVLLQPGEAVQAHVEDGLRLDLGEPVADGVQPELVGQRLRTRRDRAGACQQLGHDPGRPGARQQADARLGRRGGRLDQGDDLVDVGEGDREAFEDVGAVARLRQVENRAPGDDLATVADEGLKDLLQRHQLRLAVLQRHHVDAEHRLHRRLRVQVVEDDLGDLPALELDDDAHAVLVRLIAQAIAGDAVEQLLAHQLRDALDQARLVHLEGQLGHHDRLAVALAHRLDADAGAHRQPAAAGAVGGGDLLRAVDDAAGREVGTRHVLHQRRQGGRRVIQQRQAGIDRLGDVVRRDIGRHAHRDAGLPVDEQVGHARRQHRGLVLGFIVVGDEVDGFLVDVRQQLAGDARHAHLGVAHGRRHVAVDGAEVALPVHQQIAHGKRLRHAHDGVVHGRVTVRVVLADDIADHARGLLVRLVPLGAELAHRVQHAPVHRLQAVTHIGQGAPDDDAHCVVQVRLPHLLFEAYGQYFARDFSH